MKRYVVITFDETGPMPEAFTTDHYEVAVSVAHGSNRRGRPGREDNRAIVLDRQAEDLDPCYFGR